MIAAVVLAAGASSRMGEPKALLRTRTGASYLEAIAATARAGGCAHVTVVLGPPHGERIRAALPASATAAWNEEPARGMLSSVQAGLVTLPGDVDAALVWPVDIPFVRAATVQTLVVHDGTIVVPVHHGRGGHPLRVARAHFGEILRLDPARGLKALLEAHADRVVRLPVDDGGVLVDVDTPDDYARTRD